MPCALCPVLYSLHYTLYALCFTLFCLALIDMLSERLSLCFTIKVFAFAFAFALALCPLPHALSRPKKC
jgi:hypothetical protein